MFFRLQEDTTILYTIIKQKVMSALKRKATIDLNAKLNKLTKQELLSCEKSFNFNLSDMHLFRKVCMKLGEKYFIKFQSLWLKQKR